MTGRNSKEKGEKERDCFTSHEASPLQVQDPSSLCTVMFTLNQVHHQIASVLKYSVPKYVIYKHYKMEKIFVSIMA